MNTAAIDAYASHIRHSSQIEAIERARMLRVAQAIREMAQWGDPVPTIEALCSAKNAEDLAAMAADTVGEPRAEMEAFLISREQAAAEIEEHARLGHLWQSEDLSDKARGTTDADALDALIKADRLISIAERFASK